MKDFAQLFEALDQTTKTNAKVAALRQFFETAQDSDKLWTIALFTGRRPKRVINTTLLRQWAAQAADLPLWLFEEAYPIVGDLAETIALVLPPAQGHRDESLTHWITTLAQLRPLDEDAKRTAIQDIWNHLPTTERLLFNKLLTGGFRIGVSQKLLTRALAQATGQEEAALTHKLMGDWTPDTTSFDALVLQDDPGADASRPYPFCLAHGVDGNVADLGAPDDWLAEWKWDGIRGQLILRDGQFFLWSRGEDLMTHRFPEFARALDHLPQGTVIDGEVLAWRPGAPLPLPFADLQKRIGRKTVPKKLLSDAPAVLHAYDLLELDGRDLRDQPQAKRRELLDNLLQNTPTDCPVTLSPRVDFDTWEQLAALRETSRDRAAEGFMLKRKTAPYHAGRKRGDWWKWKVDPLSVDAVMIYAQAGHGRRANLFTDFTFAVWDGPDLVPFAKAYSGLTDAEFRAITAWVRKNTTQRFGPVRQVTPHHVFELHFEGIQASPRHKSGIALRFPRMARWRKDKPMGEANTLDDLRALLSQYG